MSVSAPIEDVEHGEDRPDDHEDVTANSTYSRQHHSRPRFESELARVLFVDLDGPVSVKATRTEAALVDAVCERLRVATQDDLHAMCSLLHASVMPRLCAESALRVAIEVERVAPWMFDIVPSLAAIKQTLIKAEEMTQIFSHARLQTLLRALKEEAVRS